jgi:hypothetical protein
VQGDEYTGSGYLAEALLSIRRKNNEVHPLEKDKRIKEDRYLLRISLADLLSVLSQENTHFLDEKESIGIHTIAQDTTELLTSSSCKELLLGL